ncbi:MAG: FAD-binding oxidoreductase [Eudoraea sp.]|nr:FAD-binding oxidoreductase [Eudoraea sp.]
MVDYLVVGLGLAGISFCEALEQHGRTFRVVSDESQQASIVAGGLYNPVILKRFTLAWKAHEQLEQLLPFYSNLEEKLGVTLDHRLRVLRRFAGIEEQNSWFEASDKPALSSLMSTSLVTNTNNSIHAPWRYGEVLGTGRIDTRLLLSSYTTYLVEKDLLFTESFQFDRLEIKENEIVYKDLRARHLVFATGFGLQQNPYFNYLPLNGTKGELLTIKAPELKETSVIKSSVFIIPLGEDTYRIGATYKWQDKTNEPTAEAREELETKLKTFLKCEYEVIHHAAGIRPTVADRRPLVGQHPIHKHLFVLNGFGSRGVMIAPYASKALFNFIENDEELNPEMDISRFRKRYEKRLAL